MSTKKRILITGLLVLGWIFTVWLAWNLSIRRVDNAYVGASDVTTQFFDSVSNGEFDKAYGLTSDIYKSENSAETFKKQLVVIDNYDVGPSNVLKYRGEVDYLTQYQFSKDDGSELGGLTIWAEKNDDNGKWEVTTVTVNK
jgi:hypothetical protein